MSGITCKFGGSSLADAACLRRAAEIVNSDSERRFIVPSAPGKRAPDDHKITDLLYAWHGIVKERLDASEPMGIIRGRFTELAAAFGVRFDIETHLDEIAKAAQEGASADYMASRGEYLNGRLLAEVLEAAFVDPAECIRFDGAGVLDSVTYELLAERLQGPGRFVIPGFYGATPDGEIKTFSRGGSDVTGAIVARASGSSLYENWTDVSGFRMADPRIVPHARRIKEITYRELRELAYMGATVLHDEAIFPLREPGIPIHILNTKDPSNPGTRIVARREAKHPVCGVAGRGGFTMITIDKTLMNKERGFGLRVLEILDNLDVSWEHMPTGIDTISLIIKDEEMDGLADVIQERIEAVCKPDNVTVTNGLAMIATVGQGMHNHVGIAARLCTACSEAGVNLRVIDQGSSEMNIIIGVEEADLGKAVSAIYEAFEAWE